MVEILQCQEKMQVIGDDAFIWLQKNQNSLANFNVIFLDPPFLQDYYNKILKILSQSVNHHCLLYVECSKQHRHFHR